MVQHLVIVEAQTVRWTIGQRKVRPLPSINLALYKNYSSRTSPLLLRVQLVEETSILDQSAKQQQLLVMIPLNCSSKDST